LQLSVILSKLPLTAHACYPICEVLSAKKKIWNAGSSTK